MHLSRACHPYWFVMNDTTDWHFRATVWIRFKNLIQGLLGSPCTLLLHSAISITSSSSKQKKTLPCHVSRISPSAMPELMYVYQTCSDLHILLITSSSLNFIMYNESGVFFFVWMLQELKSSYFIFFIYKYIFWCLGISYSGKNKSEIKCNFLVYFKCICSWFWEPKMKYTSVFSYCRILN